MTNNSQILNIWYIYLASKTKKNLLVVFQSMESDDWKLVNCEHVVRMLGAYATTRV